MFKEDGNVIHFAAPKGQQSFVINPIEGYVSQGRIKLY